jgi:hypothetical protein
MSEASGMRGGGVLDAIGAVTSQSRGTILNAGAAHTKGLWSELIAVTARPYSGFILTAKPSGTDHYGFDLGFGAAGAEQVVLPDLMIGSTNGLAHAWFPIAIPKGVRVAGRVQSQDGANSVTVNLTGIGVSPLWPRGLSGAINYGFNAGTSSGVQLDTGAVADTKGAWAEVTASTTRPAKALYVTINSGTVSAGVGADLLVDIGIGAAASEVVLIPNLYIRAFTNNRPWPPILGPFPVNIPVGTRLAARGQCSSTDAGARLLRLSLIALR